MRTHPARTGLIREGHAGTRTSLRILGPGLVLAGAVLLGYGVFLLAGNMGSAATGGQGGFEAWTRDAVVGFIVLTLGMFLLAAGAAMTWFGYMGSVARYTASEIAPVGADTVNYVGQAARPGLTAIGTAIGTGSAAARGAPAATALRCTSCQAVNATDARYCKDCGKALAQACARCGGTSPPEARFCDDCGEALV